MCGCESGALNPTGNKNCNLVNNILKYLYRIHLLKRTLLTKLHPGVLFGVLHNQH